MKYLMALMIALFVPTAAVAKGECTADRQKFCKDVVGGKPGELSACMKQHEAELSEACKAERAANLKEKEKQKTPGQQKPD
jgi:hypothetical protein